MRRRRRQSPFASSRALTPIGLPLASTIKGRTYHQTTSQRFSINTSKRSATSSTEADRAAGLVWPSAKWRLKHTMARFQSTAPLAKEPHLRLKFHEDKPFTPTTSTAARCGHICHSNGLQCCSDSLEDSPRIIPHCRSLRGIALL